jgi:signal peptidase I
MADHSNIITLAEELLNGGLSVQIKVGGHSMFPILKNGDTVFIKKIPVNLLKRGDIVVYRSTSKMIAHRILFIQNKNNQIRLITKGDSLILIDKAVSETDYIGKITAFQRKNKSYDLETARMSSQSKLTAIISFISIPFLIILLPLTLFFHFFRTRLIQTSNKIPR